MKYKAIINLKYSIYPTIDGDKCSPDYCKVGEARGLITGYSTEDCTNQIKELCKKNNIIFIKEEIASAIKIKVDLNKKELCMCEGDYACCSCVKKYNERGCGNG
jgi:hypothetical protein